MSTQKFMVYQINMRETPYGQGDYGDEIVNQPNTNPRSALGVWITYHEFGLLLHDWVTAEPTISVYLNK